MIVFERLGGWGLGNSLFQIATTCAMAHDNNTSYAFPSDCEFRKQYFNSNSIFKQELSWINPSEIKGFKRWGEGSIKYVIPPVLGENTVIDGFFQSEKYFKHIRSRILDIFDIKEEHKNNLRSTYNHLINDKSCVISFRRGEDYYRANEMRILEMDYYKSAISKFDADTLFVVFSDNINWCKEHLFFIKKKVFVGTGNNVLDLHLMSCFKNNIIANSTFSWWGAWLGESDKIVYMPSPSNNWFSDSYYDKNKHHGFQCLASKDWIIL